MPTSVRLDTKTESLVRRIARRRGVTKPQVIRDAIHRLAESDVGPKRAATVYEAIAHLMGCADSGGAQLSVRTGEKSRELLLARRRARRAR